MRGDTGRTRLLGCGVMILLAALSRVQAADTAADRSIAWAKRLAAQSEFAVQLSGKGYGGGYDLDAAEDAFKSIIAKYGSDIGPAWAGLARVQVKKGEYSGAIDSYDKALRLLPGHTGLIGERSVALQREVMGQSAQSTLPAGETVIQVEPFVTGTWAILSAKVTRDQDRPWPSITNVRLSLYSSAKRFASPWWCSPTLGYPGHTDGEFNDIYLYVTDVTGDGQPDMVVTERFHGASWTPSHIDIYAAQRGKVTHLLGAVSDDALIMRDIKGDGSFEAMTDKAVGWNLSHAAQPRWIDLYAYKNGSYVPAEKDFPGEFRTLCKEIRTVLRTAPNDFELLYYLGRCYEIERNPRAALRTYRRAEKSAVREIRYERKQGWWDLSAKAESVLAEIRSRIRKL